MRLADGSSLSCPGTCRIPRLVSCEYAPHGSFSFFTIPSDKPHDQHLCDERRCPAKCQLCKHLCSAQDHLHGLESGAVHLCGFVVNFNTSPQELDLAELFLRQEHTCTALCAAPGICEIATAPQSIEATFTGKHETFEYTKVSYGITFVSNSTH